MATKARIIPRRVISPFTLSMIIVASIVSIKNFPMMAEYGYSLIFYCLAAAILFFIPVALIVAELATGWSEWPGGVYLWTKEAFGPKWAFIAVWLQWIQNIFWYPTVLAFLAGTLASIIDPALANNKLFIIAVILIGYWSCNIANHTGMKTVGFISILGVFLGTLLPTLVLIVLGAYWLLSGNPSQIEFSVSNLMPDFGKMGNLTFFVGILLSVAGMEMPAVHTKDVVNPKRGYPFAISMATIIIMLIFIFGSLAVAVVIPQKDISLVSGIMQMFNMFFKAHHMQFLEPLAAIVIIIGSLSIISAWISGPSKGILIAGYYGYLPPLLQKTNKRHMPSAMFLLEGIIVTIVVMVFLFMPSVNSSYWILCDLCMQLYLLMYLIMFLAAIRLRYSKPHVKRPYRIPGGKNLGMWLVASIGIIGTILSLVVSFVPPSQLATGKLWFYETFIVGGIIIFCSIPLLLCLFRKPSWKNKEILAKLASEED